MEMNEHRYSSLAVSKQILVQATPKVNEKHIDDPVPCLICVPSISTLTETLIVTVVGIILVIFIYKFGKRKATPSFTTELN